MFSEKDKVRVKQGECGGFYDQAPVGTVTKLEVTTDGLWIWAHFVDDKQQAEARFKESELEHAGHQN